MASAAASTPSSNPAMTAVTVPSGGPTGGSNSRASSEVEVAKLRERLRISDEWNVRLQDQIQELLRLPHNEVDSLRDRMQNPEIAIPLLQCYDAAILEKAEENDALRKENAQLKASVDLQSAEVTDLGHAVRVAEDLAKLVQTKSTEETQRLQQSLREVQAECAQLRQELRRALDSESEAKCINDRLSRQLAEQTARVDTMETEQHRLEEALRMAADHRRRLESGEGEAVAQHEAQKIQVTLLTKEKADSLEELERLRAKMIQALRQAADNHATHMKVVEERHTMTVEQLRAALRTQELEVQKLRAQLARADVTGHAGGIGGSRSSSGGGGLLSSTTQLLEAQTRQAQGAEIHRLYGELSQAQRERDDAILRYEKLTSTLRREREQQQITLRSETAALTKAHEEALQRVEQTNAELSAVQKDMTTLRDRLNASQQALSEVQMAKEALAHQLREATAREAALSARLAACEEQLRSEGARTKERAEATERRVAATLAEVQEARTRAFAECERATQEKEEAQLMAQTLREQLAACQRAVHTGEREQLVTQTQVSRLTEALEMHKRQLSSCDEKLVTLQAQLDAARQQNRSSVLAQERLKIENARLVRAHELLLERTGRVAGGFGVTGGRTVM